MTVTLGLDLGGSSIKWLTLDGDEVTASGAIDTPTGGCDAVVAAMLDIARSCVGIEAVGVGVPGLFDRDGRTTLVPNVPGEWDGFPLVERLAAGCQLPVALANDGRAFTLAELRHGAGRDRRHLIGVTIGTGIGGGVALDGRLYLGREAAGEVGHQLVDALGPRCGCGARGCVESYASGPAIRAAAARAVFQGASPILRQSCGGDVTKLTVAQVFNAAARGDAYAIDVVTRAGRALGAGLANLCNILDPEVIVIGGGVAAGLDALLPSVQETLEERARLNTHPVVTRARLGTHTGALGAALWGRERPDRQETAP